MKTKIMLCGALAAMAVAARPPSRASRAEEKGRLIPYYDVANNGTAPHKVWLSEK